MPLFWSVAVMSFFYGAVLGYYELTMGLMPMAAAAISGAMALGLRSRGIRAAIEFHGQGGKALDGGTYYSDYRKADREERMERKAMKSQPGSAEALGHTDAEDHIS